MRKERERKRIEVKVKGNTLYLTKDGLTTAYDIEMLQNLYRNAVNLIRLINEMHEVGGVNNYCAEILTRLITRYFL